MHGERFANSKGKPSSENGVACFMSSDAVGCWVLIVEDDGLVALDMDVVLSQALGVSVTIADSCAEAERALERGFDCAVLDINVTDGETYAIARRLDEARIPFVFVSATPPDSLPADLRTAQFMEKPYREDALVATVRSACAARRQE
jgi:CheY-like chemotaxis protein